MMKEPGVRSREAEEAIPPRPPAPDFRPPLRRRVYQVLEGRRVGNTAGRVVDGALVVLIILSILAAVLETVGSVATAYRDLLANVEAVCGIAFTVELLLRVWVCTEDRHNRFRHPLRGRLRYVLTPLGLIDLISALP